MSDFGGDYGGDAPYLPGGYDPSPGDLARPTPPPIPDGWGLSPTGFITPSAADMPSSFGSFLPGAGASSFIGNALSQAANSGINRAIGAGGQAGTRVASPVTTNVNPTLAQSFGLSNNPQFVMQNGPGSSVGNALSSPVSSSPSLSPNISTPTTNTATQTDTNAGLPQSGVTRSTVPGVGAVYGTTGTGLAALLNNPMFLILALGGVFLAMSPHR